YFHIDKPAISKKDRMVVIEKHKRFALLCRWYRRRKSSQRFNNFRNKFTEIQSNKKTYDGIVGAKSPNLLSNKRKIKRQLTMHCQKSGLDSGTMNIGLLTIICLV
ncbi:MAG: hypothetical protein ABJB11_24095, partial [Ferruginibacter sp.]